MRVRLYILLLAATALLSCDPVDVTGGSEPQQSEGVELTLALKMSDILAAVEGSAASAAGRTSPSSPATKAEGGEPEEGDGTVTKSQHDSDPNVIIAEKNEITSLLLLLGKPTPGAPFGQGRIVGYRLFISPHADGDRYFCKNVNGALAGPDHIGETGTLLPDIKLSDLKNTDGGTVTWQYTNWQGDPNGDDTTPDVSQYGENGFARSAGSPYDDLVKITFDYENPLHGDVEKLTAGEYYMVAIANFSESVQDCFGRVPGDHVREMVSYWNRHLDDAGFDGIPPNAEADSGADGGLFHGYLPLVLGRFKLSDAHVQSYAISPAEISTRDVITSGSYIAGKGGHIISTLAEPIVLESGANSKSLELERLLSRTTFYLQNASTSPIRVRDFALSNNFASSATHVFSYYEDMLGGLPPITWRGQPDVQSDRNLLKFTPDLIYTKREEPNVDDNTFVLYDGLMMPSHDTQNPFTFTIEVDLPGLGGESHIETAYESEVARTPFENIVEEMDDGNWEFEETRYYLIQSIITHVSGFNGKSMFIRYKSNGQTGGEGGNDADTHPEVHNLVTSGDLSFVWGFKRVSATNPRKVKICNMSIESDNKWIQCVGKTENHTLVYTDEANASEFEISHYDYTNGKKLNGVDGCVAFTSSYSNTPVYLNLISTAGKQKLNQLVSIEIWNDEGSHFNFYRVNRIDTEITPGMPHKRETFSINALDALLGSTDILSGLRRNDHLQVQITVRYSDTFRGIDFEVETWKHSGNTVVFD